MPTTPAKRLCDVVIDRIDAMLPTFQSDTARRVFLSAQLSFFQRQARGVLEGDETPPYVPGFGYPKAVDYHLVISDIQVRLSRLSAKEAA